MGVKRFPVLLVGLLVLVGLCTTGAYAAPPTIKLIAIEKPDTTALIDGQALVGIGGQIRVRIETLDNAKTVRVRILTSKSAATGAGWGPAGGVNKVVTGLDTTAIDSVQVDGTTVEKALARVSGQESKVGKVLTAFMRVKTTVGQVDSCIVEARSAVDSSGIFLVGNDAAALNLATSLDGIFVGTRPRFAVDGDRPVIAAGIIDSVVMAGKANVFFPNDVARFAAAGISPAALNGVADTVGIGKTIQLTIGLGSGATGSLLNATLASSAKNRFIDIFAIAVRADTVTIPSPSGYVRDFSGARIKFDLSADDVVNQGKRSGSYSVVADKFKDFKRITAEAFVIDRAGNLSAPISGSADGLPGGVTSSYTFMIDDKFPKFLYTPGGTSATKTTYPDSTGQRWTGGSVAVFDTISSAGVLTNLTVAQAPLKFKVDEDLDSLTILAGSGGVQIRKPIGNTQYTVDSRRIAKSGTRAEGGTGIGSGATATDVGTGALLNTKTTAATGGTGISAGARVDTANIGSGGKQVDGTYSLRYRAIDFAGNVKDTTISSAVYDATPLEFKGLFPTRKAVDTINAATSALVFTLSEAADSVRITYRQIISGTIGRTVTTVRGRVSGGDTSIDLDKTSSEQRISVNTDSLNDGRSYALQLFGRDLARNFTATVPDTLFYKVAFQNPNPDTIRVVVYPNGVTQNATSSNDTAVVSQAKTYDTTKVDDRQFGILLVVTAVDTVLKATAITYNVDGLLLDVWSPDTTANLAGVHVKGTGVTEQAALVAGKRRANLDKSGWVLGSRFVTLTDTLAQNRLYVTVQDTISTVKKRGQSQALVFEAGAMTQYRLMVADASKLSREADTTGVAANKTFILNVQPQDRWSNPSLKQNENIYTSSKGGFPANANSTDPGGNKLGEIYLEFASDGAPVGVPAGPQRLNSTSWYAFEFGAPNENALFRITARTANTVGGTQPATGKNSYQGAIGHTWIRTSGAGGVVEPPKGDAAVTKPDTLIVEDYKGPDGSGDQGGFVMVTFKNTPQHAQLAQYRIWRFLQVNVTADTLGRLRTLDAPVGEWVPWAVVDAVPVMTGKPPISRAVIPTIDNVATRWAITAEIGNKSSEAATSSAVGSGQGKVVFSAESVKETLALLGIQSAMPAEEILKVFGPSYEYARSVLGDQKDLLLGTLDLDGLRRVAMRAPEGVRAQSAKIRASDATAAAAAVRAIDNLPPAAVTDEKEAHTDKREVTLTWAASRDDRIVGLIPYRGYAVPIFGVRTYDVFRGKGEDEKSLVKVTSLAAGSTTFKDVVSPDLGDKVIYRITATDLDNATPGKLVTVTFVAPPPPGPIKYFTADKQPVYLMLDPKDPNFSLTEGFNDFFVFADNFGKRKGDPGFNLQADIDEDGDVDFDDFFAFADAFGKTAVQPKAGKLVARAAPVSGVNRDAGLNLNLVSDRVIAGQQIKLDVAISNAAALKGYGFTLTYDPQKFELVEVTAGDQNLLSQGGNTPVFLKNAQPGRIQVANAIAGDGAAVGSGNVAQLVFNVKGEFDDIARFEIAEGILVDGSRLLNPVVTLGALDIQTTPTEFALKQNFPNPFNPETTIKYNLAASGPVEVRIYNMVGQVVRTLVNERQAAGRYSIRWDGKDDHGLSVSSGIYFYRLDTDKFHSVKKLMLLK